MRSKWLIEGILKYKGKIILAIFFIILDGISTFLFPEFISEIVDIAVPYKDSRYLLENIFGLLTVSIMSLLASVSVDYLFYNISNNFVFDIKKKIISGAFDYNGLKIQSQKDKLLTCIMEDAYMIEIIASRLLASTLLDIVTLGIIIYIMIKINVSILIFILISYPLLLYVQFLFNRKIKRANKELMEMRDDSNSLIAEFIQYIYQYIANNGQKYFENKFYDVEEKVKDKKIEICMLKTYNSYIPRLVNAIAFALIVGYCAYRVVCGDISLGELTVIIMYIRQLSTSFIRIVMAVSEFQRIGISVGRIDEVISGGENE